MATDAEGRRMGELPPSNKDRPNKAPAPPGQLIGNKTRPPDPRKIKPTDLLLAAIALALIVAAIALWLTMATTRN